MPTITKIRIMPFLAMTLLFANLTDLAKAAEGETDSEYTFAAERKFTMGGAASFINPHFISKDGKTQVWIRYDGSDLNIPNYVCAAAGYGITWDEPATATGKAGWGATIYYDKVVTVFASVSRLSRGDSVVSAITCDYPATPSAKTTANP